VRAENPAALRFILQDDIYLLKDDKAVVKPAIVEPVAEAVPEPVIIPKIEPVIAASPQVVTIPKIEPVAAPIVQETQATQFNYLGGNKKAFLVITYYPDHDFIVDAHLTALQSILKRKDHELDDIAIFNLAKNDKPTLKELLSYFKPKKLLILGKSALPEKLETLPLNEIKQAREYSVLYSFSFGDMMESTEYKKAFWDQMKNL
jgi:hypothetical protein